MGGDPNDPTRTATMTPSPSITPSVTQTPTGTPTGTPSPSKTATNNPSLTPTGTPTQTSSDTPVPSPESTGSPSTSLTPEPSVSITTSSTNTPTETSTPTITPKPSLVIVPPESSTPSKSVGVCELVILSLEVILGVIEASGDMFGTKERVGVSVFVGDGLPVVVGEGDGTILRVEVTLLDTEIVGVLLGGRGVFDGDGDFDVDVKGSLGSAPIAIFKILPQGDEFTYVFLNPE